MIRAAIVRCMTEPFSISDLKNHFKLDRRSEWKAGNTINQAARALLFSKDVLQQFRSGISDFRLIADISRSGHRHAEPDDPRHFVERSQMLSRDSENVERREVSRLAPRFHIELRADAPNKFRPMAFRGKHPGQKQQIARLHRFHIGTERLGGRRERDAKFFQPLLSTRWPRAFAGYHLLVRNCIHLSLSYWVSMCALLLELVRRALAAPALNASSDCRHLGNEIV